MKLSKPSAWANEGLISVGVGGRLLITLGSVSVTLPGDKGLVNPGLIPTS